MLRLIRITPLSLVALAAMFSLVQVACSAAEDGAATEDALSDYYYGGGD